MRRRLAAALLGLVALGVLAGCGRQASPATDGAQAEGIGLTEFAPSERADAPALAGITVGGGYVDLSSLRGKVVVLNAWASWCEPCKEELPVLAGLAASAGPDIAFVGLDVNDKGEEAIAMAARYGVKYDSIVDRDGRLLATVPGVPPGAIPSTVVIDKQGRIAARVIGSVKPSMLEPVLQRLSAQS